MTAVTVAGDTGHMEDLLLGNESWKPGLSSTPMKMKLGLRIKSGQVQPSP
jgi:hypothetical protein